MSVSFRFNALPLQSFSHLIAMTDEELSGLGARRMTVDEHPGFPCRVSLQDAAIGERVILLPYRHHDVDSPYRALGPIFVREAAQTATPAINEVPVMFTHRKLSLRAYNRASMMIDSRVVDGNDLSSAITGMLANEKVDYLHLHNAGAGCYACRIDRA